MPNPIYCRKSLYVRFPSPNSLPCRLMLTSVNYLYFAVGIIWRKRETKGSSRPLLVNIIWQNVTFVQVIKHLYVAYFRMWKIFVSIEIFEGINRLMQLSRFVSWCGWNETVWCEYYTFVFYTQCDPTQREGGSYQGFDNSKSLIIPSIKES